MLPSRARQQAETRVQAKSPIAAKQLTFIGVQAVDFHPWLRGFFSQSRQQAVTNIFLKPISKRFRAFFRHRPEFAALAQSIRIKKNDSSLQIRNSPSKCASGQEGIYRSQSSTYTDRLVIQWSCASHLGRILPPVSTTDRITCELAG